MKFVIEALGATSGGGKAGLLRLLPALASHREHSFVALLADLPEFAGLERPNLTTILQKKPGGLLAREIYLQRTVPQVCRRERADALLCLGNFGPRRTTLPTVVLLHNAHYVSGNLGVAVKPTLREALVAWYGRRYLRRLPEAARLVVQTELMKERVVTVAGVSRSRVAVIRDADALPPEAEGMAGDGRTKSLDRKLHEAPNGVTGLPSPFTFLCLAQYYPHKNLEVLADAINDSGLHPTSRALPTDDSSRPASGSAPLAASHITRGHQRDLSQYWPRVWCPARRSLSVGRRVHPADAARILRTHLSGSHAFWPTRSHERP